MLASRQTGPPGPNTFHVSRAARHATAMAEDLQLRRRIYKKDLATSKRTSRASRAAAAQLGASGSQLAPDPQPEGFKFCLQPCLEHQASVRLMTATCRDEACELWHRVCPAMHLGFCPAVLHPSSGSTGSQSILAADCALSCNAPVG